MVTRRVFGLVFCLAAIVTFTSIVQGQKSPAEPAEPNASGAGKGQRAQDFIAAFNKGDAASVAGFWTPTGEYTDQAGHKYQGREALTKLYTKVFAANKGAKLAIYVTSARMVGQDVAIEEGLTEVTPAEGGPPTVAAFSAVLVKKEGQWYFESVHDAVAHPPSNASRFESIDWLIGDWVGEANKGESSRTSYAWAENRNFIVSSFDITLNGVAVTGGTQWIGWDAVDKAIRSWTFYSGGGFGEASWVQDGNKWSLKTTARTADGKKISATNVLTKIDADHITLQMTELIVDGKPMAAPPLVKLTRLKFEGR